MARKSKKHPNIDLICKPSRDTVGYIRLSVQDKDSSGSVENQKLIIEEWGHQHQTPIMHYYIDNGFSGNRFDRPAFQQMIQDILAGKIKCIVVKALSRLGRDHITVGYHLEIFSPSSASGLYPPMTNLTQSMGSPIRIKKSQSSQEFAFRLSIYLMSGTPRAPRRKYGRFSVTRECLDSGWRQTPRMAT